jgi:hypothetical protein
MCNEADGEKEKGSSLITIAVKHVGILPCPPFMSFVPDGAPELSVHLVAVDRNFHL